MRATTMPPKREMATQTVAPAPGADPSTAGSGTPSAAPLAAFEHEELVIRRGRRTGVYTIVAVHSTALGPALGGCRMWRYADAASAVTDALSLSRAMTYKAAAAGLDLGGGKGVICLPPGQAPPTGDRRRDVLLDFADTVSALDGSYITAEDVGTSARDMVTVAHQTKWVTGLPTVHGGSGDPSPFTALGVEAAMHACCAERLGQRALAGRRVAVVGCGRVGEQLARRLALAGAELLLSDIDESKRTLAAELPRARWVDAADALLADVDVLAPCALGGVVHEGNVDRLRCAVVCGSANNQLADDALAGALARRGILYAPDFIVNAGGLINVALELDPRGYDAERARARVAGIEGVMGRILQEAEMAGVTPLAAALSLAGKRLGAAGGSTIVPERSSPSDPEARDTT
jgi:leucine dehydrogenase